MHNPPPHPIENVWRINKTRINGRRHGFHNIEELKVAIHEWERLTFVQVHIDKVLTLQPTELEFLIYTIVENQILIAGGYDLWVSSLEGDLSLPHTVRERLSEAFLYNPGSSPVFDSIYPSCGNVGPKAEKDYES